MKVDLHKKVVANVDITNINKIYNKLYGQYSKMTDTQVKKKIGEFHGYSLFRDDNIDLKWKMKELMILNALIYNEIFIKRNVKNTTYFTSKSKNKDKCFNQYKKLRELGRGEEGIAYLASKKEEKYVVKVIDIEGINFLQKSKDEIKISKKMGDLGIGPYIYDAYFCKIKGELKAFIVQEFMKGGDYETWTENGNVATPKMKKQLKEKLKLMHENGIYHNDLHTMNVFVQIKNNKPELFFGDFGRATTLDSLIKKSNTDDLESFKNAIENKSVVVDMYITEDDKKHGIRNLLDKLVFHDMMINDRLNIGYE